jgi:hypothetical protein
MSNGDAPEKLIEAWLEFHRSNLCQSMDAVFVFNKKGVEIWCLNKDGKKYKKLQQLFDPLQSSYKIEIYATRPPAPDDSDEDPAPPPSLCENYELRSYLRDPLAQLRDIAEGDDFNKEAVSPDAVLKQRLIVYAEHVLEWNSRMKQYAADLPELVRTALNPGLKKELRISASAICVGHTKELLGNLRSLVHNLTHAFPKPRKAAAVIKAEDRKHGNHTLPEFAEHIAVAAKEMSERIHRFIYPDQHTVDLNDLRKPLMLVYIKNLEESVRNFQKELSKLPTSPRLR